MPTLAPHPLRGINRWTARFRPLPDFLILGGMKCGTTTLYRALIRHPRVRAAGRKEVGYFSHLHGHGPTWYRGWFPLAGRARLGRWLGGPAGATGEATPYYLFHPHAAGRIAAAVPAVRLVALLRDPTDRAYSHYRHNVRAGREPLSFDEALDREESRTRAGRDRMLREPGYECEAFRDYSYAARGVYADQLAAYRRLFPADQLLVLSSEDYFADPAATLGRVFAHLGLGAGVPAAVAVPGPVSAKPVPAGAAARLRAVFAPHNRRLCEFIGRDFGWDKAGGGA